MDRRRRTGVLGLRCIRDPVDAQRWRWTPSGAEEPVRWRHTHWRRLEVTYTKEGEPGRRIARWPGELAATGSAARGALSRAFGADRAVGAQSLGGAVG